MADAKHTPAPWTANTHHTQFSAGRTYGFIHAGGAIPLASVTLGVEGISQDEGRANARLIAAAPELLALVGELADELERIARPEDGIGKLRHRARSALRKASGEG